MTKFVAFQACAGSHFLSVQVDSRHQAIVVVRLSRWRHNHRPRNTCEALQYDAGCAAP